jgi:ubiquitin-protein ligase
MSRKRIDKDLDILCSDKRFVVRQHNQIQSNSDYNIFATFDITIPYGTDGTKMVLIMHVHNGYPLVPPKFNVMGFHCPPFDITDHSPEYTFTTYVDGFLAALDDPVMPEDNPTMKALWQGLHTNK